MSTMKNLLKITVSLLFLMSTFVQADQIILDDLIVDGSACIGFDCVNGESFGFDTLRLKENNLRIKAQDTSSSASFPSNDWQITFNDSSNGGANKFSIDDIDGGRTPFTIEAGAPSHSLYVEDGGWVGLGTSTPVVELHIKDGDSPTLRLEQDGSSGFTPQTWDVAGNETNFFIRDATNGSKLPFRIKPGAPSNSIYIDTDGDVGLGTTSPDARLHAIGKVLVESSDTGVAATATFTVRATDGSAQILLEDTGSANPIAIALKKAGPVAISLQDTAAGGDVWYIANDTGSLTIWKDTINNAGLMMKIKDNGDMELKGTLSQGHVW